MRENDIIVVLTTNSSFTPAGYCCTMLDPSWYMLCEKEMHPIFKSHASQVSKNP